MQDPMPFIMTPAYLLQLAPPELEYSKSLDYTNEKINQLLSSGGGINKDVPRTHWFFEEDKNSRAFGDSTDKSSHQYSLMSVKNIPEEKTLDEQRIPIPCLIYDCAKKSVSLYALDQMGNSKLINFGELKDGFETLQFPNAENTPSDPMDLPDQVFEKITGSHHPHPFVIIKSMMEATQQISGLKLTENEARALYTFALSTNGKFLQGGCFGLGVLTVGMLFLLALDIPSSPFRDYQLRRDQNGHITIAVRNIFKDTNTKDEMHLTLNYTMQPTPNGFCLVLQNDYEAQINSAFWKDTLIPKALEKLAQLTVFNNSDIMTFIPLLQNPGFAQAFFDKIKLLNVDRSQAKFILEVVSTFFHEHSNTQLVRMPLGIGIGLALSALILLPLLLVIGPQALIAMAGSAILFGVGVALVVLVPSISLGLLGDSLDKMAFTRVLDDFSPSATKNTNLDNPLMPPPQEISKSPVIKNGLVYTPVYPPLFSETSTNQQGEHVQNVDVDVDADADKGPTSSP